jgi:DHA2 family multidrug resistance protein
MTGSGLIGMIGMVLSSTSVNTAVPAVMGAFGIGQDKAQWLSTAYFASMTGAMLLTSWLQQRFGQRTVFLTTMAIFIAGSFLAFSATDYSTVILARVIQGFCAGLMQPFTMAIIFTVFPPDRRGAAMGLFSLGVVLAPGLGPAIGGFITDEFSWRFVFLVPLPLAMAAIIAGGAFMPTARSGISRPFDWAGLVLMAIALGLLLDGLASGRRFGWTSDRIVLELVGGILATIAFIARQLTAKWPMLDLRLFSNIRFASAILVGIIFGFGMFGSIYAIAVFMQQVQGFSATKAGVALIPAGILMVVMFPTAGRLVDRFPAHILIMTGLFWFGFGFLLLSIADSNTPFWMFVFFTLINRFGLSLIIPSLNTGALRSLGSAQVSQGAGLINFARTFGGAAGVNLMVVFLESRTADHAQTISDSQTPDNAAAQDLLAHIIALMQDSGVSAIDSSAGALRYLGNRLRSSSNAGVSRHIYANGTDSSTSSTTRSHHGPRFQSRLIIERVFLALVHQLPSREAQPCEALACPLLPAVGQCSQYYQPLQHQAEAERG